MHHHLPPHRCTPETKAIDPEELLTRQRRVKRGVGHISALKVLMSNRLPVSGRARLPLNSSWRDRVKQRCWAPASFPTRSWRRTLPSAGVPRGVRGRPPWMLPVWFQFCLSVGNYGKFQLYLTPEFQGLWKASGRPESSKTFLSLPPTQKPCVLPLGPDPF